MEYKQSPRARSGFTLIELLIVISIISLLIAILLPALSAARESGLETKCRANLKAFGQGVMTYAQANDEFLCSGAFDPQVSNRRDGPVDRVGWVADQVNSKASFPATMLCPSNVAIYNQKLGTDGGTYTPNQAKELVRRGYNTNYTQSWYMGRTEYKPGGTGNLKSITGTFWALHTSFLRSVDSSRVPLLGDGRTDSGAFVLGQRCVKTMGDGPYGGAYGPQDYRDFGPAHGRAGWTSKGHDRIRANMLFADGHAGFFKDLDRDGEFALEDTGDQPRQKDLGSDVFDGVLTLGRRSMTAAAME
ncbi:MAG: prepilin-type N-terminal cleavage/methylation domain-containing protein [Planctomycetes bacterium]|nr:prepilin-type N-terminal cleavage/methylation domain-containing protein [Planctomycetota bacterium]